jgi:hypothetical protein
MPKPMYQQTPFQNVIEEILGQAQIDNANHGIVDGLPTVNFHGIPFITILPDQRFRLIFPAGAVGIQINNALREVLPVEWRRHRDGIGLIIDADKRAHTYRVGLTFNLQGRLDEGPFDREEALRLFIAARDRKLVALEQLIAERIQLNAARDGRPRYNPYPVMHSRMRNIASTTAMRMREATGRETPAAREAEFHRAIEELERTYGIRIAGGTQRPGILEYTR